MHTFNIFDFDWYCETLPGKYNNDFKYCCIFSQLFDGNGCDFVLVLVSISFLIISDLSSRMHRSVSRLIDRLSEAGRQIVGSQRAELDSRQAMESSERLLDEMRVRCDDLEQSLKHETKTREYLSLEFYKADGKLTICFIF